MAENKRAVIVGIPGVGKTTLITRAAEILNRKRKTTVVIFGTVMFEEAKKKMGLKNRDELRRMAVEDQRRLQDLAAQRITEMNDDIVIIDTHLFINTDEGYYPGLPMRLLSIMKPTNMVMVAADPSEIAARRKSDQTRQRDIASAENIQKELDISRVMVASCSILTGAPFAIIMNNDGQMGEAAANIAKILLGDGS
ncbi:MAG: adenylate kinase [Thermoproteota archaeon]|nr:adenylate kinase [Thermoproteota archaeon]